MAIQDYVPKLDVGYDANQAFANSNDSMRNIGQIKKATADTTAQGWKSLQDAFNSFIEQNQKDKALGLQERDITGTEAYRTADLAQREEQAQMQKNTATAEREKDYNLDRERGKREAAHLGYLQSQAGQKDKPKELPQPRETYLELFASGSEKDPKTGELITYITQDPKSGKTFVDWQAARKAFPDINKLIPRYSQLLGTYGMDDATKAKYIAAFKEWFDSGVSPEVPTIPNASSIPADKQSQANPANAIITGQHSGPDWQRALDTYSQGIPAITTQPLGGANNQRPR
jgi:hypothetical protein